MLKSLEHFHLFRAQQPNPAQKQHDSTTTLQLLILGEYTCCSARAQKKTVHEPNVPPFSSDAVLGPCQ